MRLLIGRGVGFRGAIWNARRVRFLCVMSLHMIWLRLLMIDWFLMYVRVMVVCRWRLYCGCWFGYFRGYRLCCRVLR